MYSASVTLSQLKQSRAQLGIYLQKFRNKLKGKNRVYVTQIVRLFDSIARYLESKIHLSGSNEGEAEYSQLVDGKGMDQVNLYKLMRYMQQSRIARKVDGYVAFTQEESTKTQDKALHEKSVNAKRSLPLLTHIQGFLLALTNPAVEGRFFWSKGGDVGQENVTLRYLLLDPTQHFREIVDEARAVILAGGTMSPVSFSLKTGAVIILTGFGDGRLCKPPLSLFANGQSPNAILWPRHPTYESSRNAHVQGSNRR